jgi:predicted N-acetyltransferase YhbS
MSLVIRPESPEDFTAVSDVVRRAFDQDAEARLVAMIRLTDGYIPALSLVAERDERVVGHIMFSRIHIRTTSGERAALALAPMAVDPDVQRQGIGSSLVQTGLAVARQLGELRVIVLGHPEYYPRFGFQPADRWGVQPPVDWPREAFMALELAPGALADCSGTVEYPSVFFEV